ncbi:deaminase [Roseivivax sp. CAU 1761]
MSRAAITPSPAERAALDAVLDRAVARARPGGGPVFTAAIVRDGRVIALCDNEVDRDGDPSRHAEIVAIAAAAREAGGPDLSGATLVASMQPCEMCLAAMRWAGIGRLVFAMTQERAPDFFRFPGLGLADFARASGDAFGWVGGLDADRVAHIYESGA